MKLNAKVFCAVLCIEVLLPGVGLGATPTIITPASPGNTGAAPIGIEATTSLLLFTQPFCPGLQTRGIYSTALPGGASTLTTPFTSAVTDLDICTENALTISPGLGGFTAGDTFASAASTTGTDVVVLKNGTTTFVSGIPASKFHADVAFDTAGTFGGDLIVAAEGSVKVYNSAGTLVSTFPAPANYVLEGAAVAPITYVPCPGCLVITAEQDACVDAPACGLPGAIFFVLPGTPSGTMVSKLLDTPGTEPEGISFVTSNALQCTNSGFDYFLSGYATGSQIDTGNATNGAILAFTPSDLTNFAGQFLVPDEVNGNIYAFSSFSSATTPSIFSVTGYQLEGNSILQCPTHGCPATFGFWKHHPFPSAMFVNGQANIGCHLYTNNQLLAILNSNNAGGNAVTILGHQLIAAIANITAGSVQTPEATLAIGEATALLCANNIDMTTSFVQASTPLGQQMTALADTLDAFNSSGSNCEGQP